MIKRCSTCKHAATIDADCDRYIECRRYPPPCPRVGGAHYCGEYREDKASDYLPRTTYHLRLR